MICSTKDNVHCNLRPHFSIFLSLPSECVLRTALQFSCPSFNTLAYSTDRNVIRNVFCPHAMINCYLEIRYKYNVLHSNEQQRQPAKQRQSNSIQWMNLTRRSNKLKSVRIDVNILHQIYR